MGIETIAAALGEARDAIEEIVEPYLMQQGFVQRTPRGRILTGAAYGHLGLNAPPPRRFRPACSRMTTNDGSVEQGLGHFDGKAHILPLRVYYEDTDLSGMVYHANYLRYMERGRTEFFRLAGISQMADLAGAEPTAWAIRNAEIAFHRPARLDDSSACPYRHHRHQRRAACCPPAHLCRGDLLTDGRIEACIITLTGKPRRIPQDIRDLLMPFLYETEA